MQKTYNCLIVDDEQLARNLLSAFVAKVPFLNEVGSCKSPLQAMEIMRSEAIDILLVDIQMPELSGIDFVKSLAVKPVVIFTTAYSEYAVQSYELDTIDYLLKPFSFERFMKAINKGVEFLVLKNQTIETVNNEEVFFVKGDQKIHKLFTKDIFYIEGLKEYVSFFVKDKQRIISLNSLTKLERELEKYQFIRVHRSYIVNLNHVTAFETHALWIDDKEIPIGKTYRESVKKKINW
ncbi:LytR/AlgR family response regulator transcription factor [Flammeovirga kamogawensis]|uniref:LytTR family DNA-binding domain-containing protein n=1 Tax=Flammeovirga kamogawensis TaxID=373891 RepID=A0ABX8GVD2_9BACT|nr:LytTR family DNA-binding domain-containing protein [Flammeovirga kamogawensis]MBB6464038.1 DNA-binding LytR/AlgR family response regulator [Flammeovirga kamogawensis]QWG07368.1 LytTR family DNA-binding domain-containing protein [Flammeovirga kamogawensis]TRX69183.1 response regulator transcription factor [Flammeovirga kamogawensis]